MANNFSENSTRALNLSLEAARQFGHGYIGTEHLLLGVLRQSDSGGVRLVKGFARRGTYRRICS